MSTLLIVISALLIAIVLLQAGKAEQMSFSGASESLFKNRKERGGELFITRCTILLGTIYFVICLVQGF